MVMMELDVERGGGRVCAAQTKKIKLWLPTAERLFRKVRKTG